jgi:hypothetical protein
MRHRGLWLVGALAAMFAGGCGGSAPSRTPTVKAGVRGSTAETIGDRTPASPAAHPVAKRVQKAAALPCRKFDAQVAPYAVGTGLRDVIKLSTAWRSARQRLADRLDDLPASSADHHLLAIYTARLRSNNRWLTAAISRAKADDVRGTYDRLGRWQAGLKVEQALIRQLQLRACS